MGPLQQKTPRSSSPLRETDAPAFAHRGTNHRGATAHRRSIRGVASTRTTDVASATPREYVAEEAVSSRTDFTSASMYAFTHSRPGAPTMRVKRP